MLGVIGVERLDDLWREIPEELRLKSELNIPSARDENQLFNYLLSLANQNISAAKVDWYLGAGLYDRYIPATVGALISRGEFLTAYTPYQPELSQGYLQTIYEFQSMVAELYGMDLANASMYDGSTAMAEAARMASAITGKTRVSVSAAVHPNYREVLRTYAWASDLEVQTLEQMDGETVLEAASDTACIIVQYPNFFGSIEDLAAARKTADSLGAMLIVVADPIACALLKSPGEYGADIVVGEGQPLGVAMGYGGPLVGLFTTKSEHIRRIPGRIVGLTQDAQNRPGYVMTLRTREQDIRRDKATSNICTNEALMALAATIYMSALGKNGMKSVADSSVRNTQYAVSQFKEAGFAPAFNTKVFGEVAIDLGRNAATVRDQLLEHGIMAGLPLGDYYPGMDNYLLAAFTENRRKEQIDRFVDALKHL